MPNIAVKVTINGGPDNPWHRMGFRCNPFPAIPRAEFATANRLLQELDSDPLASVDDVRRILRGCDPDFVECCCLHYKKGERVSFTVDFPE